MVPAFLLLSALLGRLEAGHGGLGASLQGGGFILYPLAIFLVGAAFEGASSRTPGKLLVGIRVSRADGGRAGWGRALVRNAMRFVDYLMLFLVGIVAMLLSRSNQRLGDRVAGTYVVLDRRPSRSREATAASVDST